MEPRNLGHNAEHPEGASFAIATCGCGAEWDMVCDHDGNVTFVPRNPLAQVACPLCAWM